MQNLQSLLDSQHLYGFLSGNVNHLCGLNHSEILKQDDAWWESEHDYIQWLFPLLEHSAAQPQSPVLDPEEVHLFRRSEDIQNNMLKAHERFVEFLCARGDLWLVPSNHNHLRITRVIISMDMLTNGSKGGQLYRYLTNVNASFGKPISKNSLDYWKEACNYRKNYEGDTSYE